MLGWLHHMRRGAERSCRENGEMRSTSQAEKQLVKSDKSLGTGFPSQRESLEISLPLAEIFLEGKLIFSW